MNQAFTLNREVILERLGGDEEIFTVMIDMYLQDLDSYCNNLANALQAREQANLQREAHTIKGLFATFADEAGTQAAYSVEQLAKQGKLDGLEEPVAAIQARLRVVGEVLKAELA